LKPYVMSIGILAMILLAGCSASTKIQPSTTIPVWLARNDSKPTRMTNVPADLGLLAPQVSHYECSGGYQPAAQVKITPSTPPSEMELPFWQFTSTCVNPDLKFNLPKGTMRAGMVWVFELPTDETTLLGAMQFNTSASDLKVASIGNIPVGMGRMNYGGYRNNLLWFIGGKTTYKGVDRTYHKRVLVFLTGRAVPMTTLEEFAKSMHPLSR